MGFRIKQADVNGCKAAFLVTDLKPTLSAPVILALSALRDQKRIKSVKLIKGFDQATVLLAQFQQWPKSLRRNRFFKLQGDSEIVPAFNNIIA